MVHSMNIYRILTCVLEVIWMYMYSFLDPRSWITLKWVPGHVKLTQAITLSGRSLLLLTELPNCVSDRWREGGFFGNFSAFWAKKIVTETWTVPRLVQSQVQSCAEFLMHRSARRRERRLIRARTIKVRTEKLDGLQKYEWDYVRVRN